MSEITASEERLFHLLDQKPKDYPCIGWKGGWKGREYFATAEDGRDFRFTLEEILAKSRTSPPGNFTANHIMCAALKEFSAG